MPISGNPLSNTKVTAASTTQQSTFTPEVSQGIAVEAVVASYTPALTNNQFSPIYVTQQGRLIVDNSKVTQPVSGTISLASAGISAVTYSEIASIANNVDSTILSYHVPLANTLYLRHISTSGTNIGAYTVLINGSLIDKKLTYYTYLNLDFFFESDVNSGVVVSGGSTLEVHVTPNGTDLGDFNASIFGRLV